MGSRLVVFLSDFGTVGAYAGMCRAVIARTAHDVATLDLTHAIPPHDVRTGALTLTRSLPYLPNGAVCLAVVDPGVGTERRAVAVRAADGRLLVGPDNGLLWPALERCGGVTTVVDLLHSPVRLDPVSPTFHGRDVFAPVAAHLASGIELGELGEPLDPASLVGLDLPRARLEGHRLVAHALLVDGFGNISLNASAADATQLDLQHGDGVLVGAGGSPIEATFATTFAEVEPGALLVYVDSSGHLALARRDGSASQALAVGHDDEVALARADPA